MVEDEPTTRELLRRTLEGSGWVVEEARDGRAALDSVARQRPALILLDLMLPELDGFGVLRTLRAAPDWQTIPVVVVTAMDLSAPERAWLTSREQVIQKGAFSREGLLREVHDLVRVYLPGTALEPLLPAAGE